MTMILKKVYFKFKLDILFGKIFSFIDLKTKPKLKIMDVDETVDYIISHQCSVSRFGDGELHIATEGCSIGFQVGSGELKNELCKVLRNDDNNLLVCLPSPINDFSYMTDEAQEIWKNDLKYNRHRWYSVITNKDKVYGDTQFTRPYIDYKDKNQSLSRFVTIRKIWNNRDVIIIEGEQSKLGVNNDLFKNASSVSRILCPSKNAFTVKNKVVETVKKYDNSHLFLIALGPTATIIAYELCILGFQAIDIGHLDIEYEWCTRGVSKKVAIEGKFTNEAENNNPCKLLDHSSYEQEIIERVLK